MSSGDRDGKSIAVERVPSGMRHASQLGRIRARGARIGVVDRAPDSLRCTDAGDALVEPVALGWVGAGEDGRLATFNRAGRAAGGA